LYKSKSIDLSSIQIRGRTKRKERNGGGGETAAVERETALMGSHDREIQVTGNWKTVHEIHCSKFVK